MLSVTHEQRGQTCAHTQKKPHTRSHRHCQPLQCDAISEASGLSGSRTFISYLSSFHKTVGERVCFVCWLSPVDAPYVITPQAATMSTRHVSVRLCLYVRISSFPIQIDSRQRQQSLCFFFLPHFWKSVSYQAEQNSQLLNMYTSLWHVNNSQIKHFHPCPDRHTLTHQISCLDRCCSNQSPLCAISVIKEHVHTHSSPTVDMCLLDQMNYTMSVGAANI